MYDRELGFKISPALTAGGGGGRSAIGAVEPPTDGLKLGARALFILKLGPEGNGALGTGLTVTELVFWLVCVRMCGGVVCEGLRGFGSKPVRTISTCSEISQ